MRKLSEINRDIKVTGIQIDVVNKSIIDFESLVEKYKNHLKKFNDKKEKLEKEKEDFLKRDALYSEVTAK